VGVIVPAVASGALQFTFFAVGERNKFYTVQVIYLLFLPCQKKMVLLGMF
jgi:hypothetical protein